MGNFEQTKNKVLQGIGTILGYWALISASILILVIPTKFTFYAAAWLWNLF